MRIFIAQSHIWQRVLGRLMECHSQTLSAAESIAVGMCVCPVVCGQTNVWLRLMAIRRCITGNVPNEFSILEVS